MLITYIWILLAFHLAKCLGMQNGSVKTYTFNLTQRYLNQDGNYKQTFVINGQTPGPMIFADEGDWVKVTIHNNLPVCTTLHFHGILQKGTPWSDGVAGVTQKAINPGESYEHFFQFKEQYGFSWYHAHVRGYSSDGLYGPIYVRPNINRERPYRKITNDTKLLSLFTELEKNPSYLIADDMFKWSMDEIIARMETYGIDPLCGQSILINGKGRVYCHDQKLLNEMIPRRNHNYHSVDAMGCLPVENGFINATDVYGLEIPGYSRECTPTLAELYTLSNDQPWIYLNILNSGGQFTKAFSIDSHSMFVVAVDGVFVDPYEVVQLIIPVGSRISVLVKAKQGTYPFRFAVFKLPQVLEGIGYLVNTFNGDSTNIMPAKAHQDLAGKLLKPGVSYCPNDTIPFEQIKKYSLSNVDSQHTFSLMLSRTSIISFSMFQNGELLPQDLDLQHPLLESFNLSQAARHKWIMEDNIKLGDIVDIVINNDQSSTHPVHLHGHLFYVISSSEFYNFPYKSVADAESHNFQMRQSPPLVDVALVPPGGYVLIRFVADNPGLWFLHCHNLGHLLGGMGALLVEAPDDIPLKPQT